MPTEPPRSAAVPPPWVAFPGLPPEEPANQGAVETYIALTWLPFWSALSDADQGAYLDRWAASPAWRAAIAQRYGPSDVDFAAEAEAHARNERARAARQRVARWNPFRDRGTR